MSKLKSVLFLAIAISAAADASAAEYYRRNPQKRFLGSNQGNVGSCEAESDIAALESVFALQNLPVKLSTFYRHAKNWVEFDGKPDLEGTYLRYNTADKALLARAGAIVPDFMLPEDTEGFNPYETGMRPHVSDMAVVDSSFVPAEQMGFKKDWWSFKPGYSNTRDLNSLKAEVAAGKAVTVSIITGPFKHMKFHPLTGLLTARYDRAKIAAEAGEDFFVTRNPTHALAVVGWDDSLYADHGYSVPGALIVRNSWNSAEAVAAAAFAPYSLEQLRDLQAFKFKLTPNDVLPGYHAIPYEYFLDHARVQKGGFDTFNLDYNRFANEYSRLAASYQVVTAPFACEGDPFSSFGVLAKIKTKEFGDALVIVQDASKPQAARQRANRDILKILNAEGSLRFSFSEAAFSFAKIARHQTQSIDRVADFYAGKFRDYYCRDAKGQWPYAAHYANSRFQTAMEKLSGTPYDQRGWYSVFNSLFKMGAHNDQQ
jgi:hypothetical protein